MKIALSILVMITSVLVNDIAKINQLKSDAREAYQQGDYQTALKAYTILVDSFGVQEEEIIMNLANSAYLLSNPGKSAVKGLEETPSREASTPNPDYLKTAQTNYTLLSQNASPVMKSLAYNQLGAMAYQQAQAEAGGESLQHAKAFFKEALKKNSTNEDARYNYELVSKMLEQQQNQDQDNQQDQQDQQEQNQDQQQQQQQQNQSEDQQQESGEDQQQQDQNGQEQSQPQEDQQGESQQEEEEPSEESQEQQPNQDQPTEPSQVEDMKISEEKAKMILEAMKNAEIQYIQQNKRKATKRPESGKPDW